MTLMSGEQVAECYLVAATGSKQKLSTHSFSQRNGIAYERRVTRLLTVMYPNFAPHVKLRYRYSHESFFRHAIIDGLLLQGICLIAVEIKNEDSQAAVVQLGDYMSLLRKLAPGLEVRGCMVVNNHRVSMYPYGIRYVQGLTNLNGDSKLAVWMLSQRELKHLERENSDGGCHGDQRSADFAAAFVRADGGGGHRSIDGVRLPWLGTH